MLSDPLADLLTRIRNAQAVNHQTVSLPYSRLKEELLKILVKNQYITGYGTKGKKPAEKQLKVSLKYNRRQPAITTIKRLSKPGVRLYTNKENIQRLIRGRGTVILSTPKGLITARQAQKLGIGGEVICKVI